MVRRSIRRLFDIIEPFHGSLAAKSDLASRTHGVATRFRPGGQPFSQKRETRSGSLMLGKGPTDESSGLVSVPTFPKTNPY
jgi:hypothetical protein